MTHSPTSEAPPSGAPAFEATAFEESVTEVVLAIPFGEVSTYGEVAAESGYPGAARAVGNLLRTSEGLPWWRVVAANGRLVPGKEADHAERLRAEGIHVVGERARMKAAP